MAKQAQMLQLSIHPKKNQNLTIKIYTISKLEILNLCRVKSISNPTFIPLYHYILVLGKKVFWNMCLLQPILQNTFFFLSPFLQMWGKDFFSSSKYGEWKLLSNGGWVKDYFPPKTKDWSQNIFRRMGRNWFFLSKWRNGGNFETLFVWGTQIS